MRFLARLWFGPSKSASSPSGAKSEDIVMAYGAVLEKCTPTPVVDIKELPYPKDEIKRAILAEHAETANPKMQEHLRSGYLMLAGFQTGVGPTPPRLDDLPKVDPSKIDREFINNILPKVERAAKWSAIMETEMQILISELRTAGIWKG